MMKDTSAYFGQLKAPYPKKIRLVFLKDGVEVTKDIVLTSPYDKYHFYTIYLEMLSDESIDKIRYYRHKHEVYTPIKFSDVLRVVLRSSFMSPKYSLRYMDVIEKNHHKEVVE